MSAVHRSEEYRKQLLRAVKTLPPAEEAEYREFINRNCGFVDGVLFVGDQQFDGSEVLRRLAPESYEAGYIDFREAKKDEVIERVASTYPTPIAYWCHMFSRVFDNELQRWLFLKDTWEATIRLLHALMVAELRQQGLTLIKVQKEDFDWKALLSDSMDRLLLNIETIVRQGESASWQLTTTRLLGKGVPNQLRNLNRLRNAFAHNQTPNELQARLMTEEALDVLVRLFELMDALAEMRLIRFKRFDEADYLRLRCEPFFGASTTPDRLDIVVSQDELTEVRKAQPPYLEPSNALVYWNRQFYCLSPFFHVHEVHSRHGSQLCMFKRTRQLDEGDRVLEFEVLGAWEREMFPRAQFDPHIEASKGIFTDQSPESTPE